MKYKKFKLRSKDIQQLIPPMGYCMVTDRITVDGKKIGYMYRETPENQSDSGWRFFSGDESQDYVDDSNNISIFDVNTVANYDPSIIKYLRSPVGVELERRREDGNFVVIYQV